MLPRCLLVHVQLARTTVTSTSMAVVASCGLELAATARRTLNRTARSFSPAHTNTRILKQLGSAHHVGRRG